MNMNFKYQCLFILPKLLSYWKFLYTRTEIKTAFRFYKDFGYLYLHHMVIHFIYI